MNRRWMDFARSLRTILRRIGLLSCWGKSGTGNGRCEHPPGPDWTFGVQHSGHTKCRGNRNICLLDMGWSLCCGGHLQKHRRPAVGAGALSPLQITAPRAAWLGASYLGVWSRCLLYGGGLSHCRHTGYQGGWLSRKSFRLDEGLRRQSLRGPENSGWNRRPAPVATTPVEDGRQKVPRGLPPRGGCSRVLGPPAWA